MLIAFEEKPPADIGSVFAHCLPHFNQLFAERGARSLNVIPLLAEEGIAGLLLATLLSALGEALVLSDGHGKLERLLSLASGFLLCGPQWLLRSHEHNAA